MTHMMLFYYLASEAIPMGFYFVINHIFSTIRSTSNNLYFKIVYIYIYISVLAIFLDLIWSMLYPTLSEMSNGRSVASQNLSEPFRFQCTGAFWWCLFMFLASACWARFPFTVKCYFSFLWLPRRNLLRLYICLLSGILGQNLSTQKIYMQKLTT